MNNPFSLHLAKCFIYLQTASQLNSEILFISPISKYFDYYYFLNFYNLSILIEVSTLMVLTISNYVLHDFQLSYYSITDSKFKEATLISFLLLVFLQCFKDFE